MKQSFSNIVAFAFLALFSMSAFALDLGGVDLGGLFGAVVSGFKNPLIFVFVVMGVVGMTAHFIKDAWEGAVDGGLSGWLRYMFVDMCGRTLATALGLFAAGNTWLLNAPAPVSIFALSYAAFFAGYSLDSLINKGSPPS